MTDGVERAETVRRLERAMGSLTGAAVARMDDLPWYRALSPEHRSWVGLVSQAGIAAFISWYRTAESDPGVTADVFGTAPRELARAVTLQQTVELIRIAITVVEEHIDVVSGPGERAHAQLLESVLRYSREVAFAAAAVYAQAAEARGAWDARLEALVVDALLRGEADETLRSRAAALGWAGRRTIAVVVGSTPRGMTPDDVVDRVQGAARSARIEVLTAVQGERLVAVVAGARDPLARARTLVGQFGPGPVVVGPPVPDLLSASRSAAQALSGLRAAAAWPEAPRPVASDDLVAERALDGDVAARRQLVEDAYRPLAGSGAHLLDTLSAFLEQAPTLEAAARLLFVHPNTVRYRLRRIAELTGYSPTDERAAFALRIALVLGRLADSSETGDSRASL